MAEQIKNETPKLAQIELPEVLKFNNVISTLTTTSMELEKTISDLFGKSFEDFEGCKLVSTKVNGRDILKCKLYFRPCHDKKDGGIYAIKTRGESISRHANNPYSLRTLVETAESQKQKQFDIEDFAKELLAEFIYVQDAKIVKRYNEDLKKTVDVRLPKNWSPYISEIRDRMMNTVQITYVAITIDVLPVIWKLFGRKDPKEVKALAERNMMAKNRYDYNVRVAKTINIMNELYLLEIQKIDKRELEKISNVLGGGPINGSINMTKR